MSTDTTFTLYNFYELPELAQEEAMSNHDSEEIASQYYYWDMTGNDFESWTADLVLWDTSEIMRTNDPDWNGSLVWSNSCGFLCNLTDDEITIKGTEV